MVTGLHKRLLLGMTAALVVATFAAYLPVLSANFINYDDNKYVTENPHLREGLAGSTIAWAFTSTYAANWHPLTWISHAADQQFFDTNAAGHHATSLLLHLFNTAFLFILLREMTGSFWRSAIVAALFGLHPAHVESVAWIAERKDVLSTAFFLLTLWAYAHYVARTKQASPGHIWYWAAVLLFVLGLMSKPMLVTLPCVLLVLDFWPLNRCQQVSWWALLREKAPFFALAGAASIVTLIAQKRGGAVVPLEAVPFQCRFENGLVAYVRYAGELVWPCHLAVIYPYPRDLSSAIVLGAFLAVLLVSAAAVTVRKQAPYCLAGWAWFMGTLVPVIGLVQVGEQAMADRYTYIPSIGLFIGAVWTAGAMATRWALPKGLVAGAVSLILASLALVAFRQASYWKDSVTLFTHTINVTENNATAHVTLGTAYESAGRSEDAAREYARALEIIPQHYLAHNNYGVLLSRQGRYTEAIAHYQAALAAMPDNEDAHYNLANALNSGYLETHAGTNQVGRHDPKLSREHYRYVLTRNPARIEAHVNLGNLELSEGNLDAAKAHYEDALRADPKSWLAWYNLGNLQSKLGQINEAISSFAQACAARSDDVESRLRLADLLIQRGQLAEALAPLRTATSLSPTHWTAHYNLGGVLTKLGKYSDASQCFSNLIHLDPARLEGYIGLARIQSARGESALAAETLSAAAELHPRDAALRRRLAVLMEQVGARELAVSNLSIVAELNPVDAQAHYDLAIALARQGRNADAIEHFKESISLNPEWVAPLNNLAWLLATAPEPPLRNGKEAVRLAAQACQMTNFRDPGVLGTLDAAYAESGDFDKAIKTADSVCQLAMASGKTNLLITARARRDLYLSGKPFHESRAARP